MKLIISDSAKFAYARIKNRWNGYKDIPENIALPEIQDAINKEHKVLLHKIKLLEFELQELKDKES